MTPPLREPTLPAGWAVSLPRAVFEIVERDDGFINGAPAARYLSSDELHLAQHARNRAAGRLGGQLRLRVRCRGIATGWFDYLLCTASELADPVDATPWRVDDIDNADAPFHMAVLGLR